MAVKKDEFSKESKLERIAAMQAALKKKFKDDSNPLMKLGDKPDTEIPVIPTGIKTLDIALGGGIPIGRIIEIYGGESSGKTSISNTIVAQVQKNGGIAGYIDCEHAYDPSYARKLGVDTDEMYFAQPNYGEEAFMILEEMIKARAYDVIIFDSIAAAAPLAEIEGEITDANIALQARMVSKALRKLSALIDASKTAVVFINQTRQNISTTGYGGGGEVTTGGKALKFYASVRLEMRKLDYIRKSDLVIGQRVKLKTVKNKIAAPFKVVELEYLFESGFSTEGMIIDIAMDYGIINRSGAWYYYKDQKFNGKDNLREELKKNPELSKVLEDEVNELIQNGSVSIENRDGSEDL